MGFAIRLIQGVKRNRNRRVAYLEPEDASAEENFAELWETAEAPGKGKGRLKLKPNMRRFARSLMGFWVDGVPHEKIHSWNSSQQGGDRFAQRVWSFEPGGALRFAAFCVDVPFRDSAMKVLVFVKAFKKHTREWGDTLKESMYALSQRSDVKAAVLQALSEE